MSSGPLYLGFDLSTQQLKAIVVSSDLSVVSEAKVDFDDDFGKQYGLKKGVYVKEEEGEVTAPVAMWLEAIDLVLDRLQEKTPMDRIKGISGSCQQHGSVFWNHDAEKLLAGLNPAQPLVDQLKGALSHPYAPNWQDQSTQTECDQFDAQLGSPERLAEVTGSAAHHRFTGTQIMRLRKKYPDMYANTSRISLVSSWLASLLLGAIAPLDISEACGMNLWDIPAAQWNESLLELCAGGKDAVPALKQKLSDPREDGGGSMGSVCDYFVQRHGFSANCQVAPFTGDNPATILALPLRPMDAIVSLGTSTTFLTITPNYRPDPSYHFFNHPTTPGQYMFMLCYKNGGLAREKIRDKLPKPDGGDDAWANFNEAVLKTPPLGARTEQDKAKLGLYFYLREVVPNIRAGTWRYECGQDGGGLRETTAAEAAGWTAEEEARIIVESQALSMRLRSSGLVSPPRPGFPAQARRIYLVGGGSLNPAIARVIGEVLGGVDGVYKLDVGGNACALGGAYKAVWAFERRDRGESFDELVGRRWREEGSIEKVDVGYREGTFEKYGAVLGAFEQMEKEILKTEQR